MKPCCATRTANLLPSPYAPKMLHIPLLMFLFCSAQQEPSTEHDFYLCGSQLDLAFEPPSRSYLAPILMNGIPHPVTALHPS